MDQDIKKHWVKALRSGDYEQGAGSLCRAGRYCCLGVLTHEVGGEVGGYWTSFGIAGADFWRFVDGSGKWSASCLTLALRKHVGLTCSEQATLMHMNDDGRNSFADIADYIEENL